LSHFDVSRKGTTNNAQGQFAALVVLISRGPQNLKSPTYRINSTLMIHEHRRVTQT